MNSIAIDFEPVHIPSSDVEAVRKCMAHLRICVNSECVTFVLDKRAKSTRETITTSLYPFAEWIAANWWSLFHEPWTPGRDFANRDFESRHSARYAGDGFAFPDFKVVPEGDAIRLAWDARRTVHQNVDFLGFGTCRARPDEVRTAFEQFIDAVLARLDSQGVTNSWLHEEWAAIQDATSDEEQRLYCERAAATGLDPFSASDEAADQIEKAAAALEDSMKQDFFEATEARRIEAMLGWVKSTESISADAAQAQPSFWRKLRQDFQPSRSKLGSGKQPWERGYAAASRCRELLSLESELRIGDFLSQTPLPILTINEPPVRSVDAIVRPSAAVDSPVCFTPRGGPTSRRFALFRGLFDYLNDNHPVPRLLTASQTSRQQAGRAFAAEFLAPSWLLKEQISSTEIVDEDVAELADAFGVSEYVIRQVANHDLARLVN